MAQIINAVVPRVEYTATGGQTVFTVPFEFFANADLEVYDNGTQQTLTTHYTVVGAGVTGGGTITFTSGRTAGHTIVILRNISIARLTDFPTSGPFNVDLLNTDLDRITAMLQEVEEGLSRAIQLDGTIALSGAGLDADGRRVVNVATPITGTDAVNKSYADAITGLVTAPAAAAAASASAAAASASAAATSASAAATTVALLPTWRKVPGGSVLVTTGAPVASIVIALPTGWQMLRLTAVYLPASFGATTDLVGRLTTGGTVKSGASDYKNAFVYADGTSLGASASTAASIMALGLPSGFSGFHCNVESIFFTLASTTAVHVRSRATGLNGANITDVVRYGTAEFTGDITALTLFLSGGMNISSGRFELEYC